MRFALIVVGFAFSGAAWAADSDGDGVEDDVDACPIEDATGHDFYVDGCVDTVEDYVPWLESLGLEADAETALVIVAGRAARAAAGGHIRAAQAQVHLTQSIARALFFERSITLDQLHAINEFARAVVETI
jgi:hypothetical protein